MYRCTRDICPRAAFIWMTFRSPPSPVRSTSTCTTSLASKPWRAPRARLYGASSLSGTLRIITNKPDPSGLLRPATTSRATSGKTATAAEAFEGFMNIPLADHAAIRIVGYAEHDWRIHQQRLSPGHLPAVLAERDTCRGRPRGRSGRISPTYDPVTINNSNVVQKDFNPGRHGGWSGGPQGRPERPMDGDADDHRAAPENQRGFWHTIRISAT